jgi:hypothetical protein
MRLSKLLPITISLFLATASFAQYHILIYDLPAVGIQPDPSIYGLKYVDGISARENWSELEREEGQYDWSYFDQVVGDATAAGKFVELRVLVEGSNAPTWVLNTALLYSIPEGGRIWVYWDSFGQTQLDAMYAALGARYSSNPYVTIVAVACDTYKTGDWDIPHTTADISQWTDPSQPFLYTSAKNIGTCNLNIDTCASAFPNQVIYLAGGRNGNLDLTPDYVAEAVARYGYSTYPTRFEAGKNQLNETTPDPFVSGGQSAIGTNWQYLWDLRGLGPQGAQEYLAAYGDPSYADNGGNPPIPGGTQLQNWAEEFRSLLQIGHDWNLVTLEVYEADVLNLGYILKNNN